MKEFEIIYSPENKFETLLFTSLDLNKLADPINIVRDNPVQAEEHIYDKKKSELVDYEDEDYIKLREMEQDPLIITDAEQKIMSGMFQGSSDNSSMYFALINTGSSLKMVPISKWYKFVQKNQFIESGDVDKIEKNLVNINEQSSESEIERPEIDYHEEFDDDNEEDNEVFQYQEKKLSSSGKKIQGIVESYDDNDESPKDKTKADEENKEEQNSNKKAKTEKTLTKEDIRNVFGSKKISVKDLLIKIKLDFKMGDFEKNLIREFIHENCIFETDLKTGEKVFRLK